MVVYLIPDFDFFCIVDNDYARTLCNTSIANLMHMCRKLLKISDAKHPVKKSILIWHSATNVCSPSKSGTISTQDSLFSNVESIEIESQSELPVFFSKSFLLI